MADAQPLAPLFPRWVRNLLGASALAIALLLVGIGAAILAYEWSERDASRFATGTVVDIASGTTFGASEYETISTPMYPVVQVVDEGRSFRFQNADGQSPPAYAIGDVVPVMYDPLHPGEGAIDTGYSWFPVVCLGVSSAPFFALAVLLFWRAWLMPRSNRAR